VFFATATAFCLIPFAAQWLCSNSLKKKTIQSARPDRDRSGR